MKNITLWDKSKKFALISASNKNKFYLLYLNDDKWYIQCVALLNNQLWNLTAPFVMVEGPFYLESFIIDSKKERSWILLNELLNDKFARFREQSADAYPFCNWTWIQGVSVIDDLYLQIFTDQGGYKPII